MVEKSENNSKKKKKNKREKKGMDYFAIAVIIIIAVAIGAWYYWTELKPVKTTKTTNVIATVNGQNIELEQFNKDYDFFFYQAGYPEQYKALIPKESFLNQSIDQLLLLQEAAKLGIEFTDKEVDDAVVAWLEKNNIDAKELESSLKGAGFTLDDFKSNFKKQIILINLINQTVISGIDIKDSEIKDYYNTNKDKFENVSFEDVKEKLTQALLAEKQRISLNLYIKQLRNKADIKIYGVEKTAKKVEEKPKETNKEKTNNNSLGTCLAEKGVKLYGAEDCKATAKQKTILGDSLKYINYIDCSNANNTETCKAAELKGYPTWIINEKSYLGKYTLKELSKLSGCQI